ncbi:hypothetical protein KIL84_000329 [Mauremys mutica]|uniref:Uncharacterized protein n=1 Tax=Mauremys mutica TaxID=74926 RepID=A0A9D3XFM7_9SAUR|nr:hypothetical protein KIL84_000329 [Mauremys mutica]
MLQCPPAFALTPQQASARGCSQRTVGKVAVTILCQDSDLPHRTAAGARQNPTQLAEADPAGGRQTGCRRKTQGMSGKGGKKGNACTPRSAKSLAFRESDLLFPSSFCHQTRPCQLLLPHAMKTHFQTPGLQPGKTAGAPIFGMSIQAHSTSTTQSPIQPK